MTSAPRLRRWIAGAALAGGFALLVSVGAGCVDERQPLGARPPACKDGNCSIGAGTSLGTGGGGGGTAGDGGAQGVTVTGSVGVTSSETFEKLTPYMGEASILAPALGGGTVSAPYGGMSGTTFTLEKVQSGLAWLLVQDETAGGSGILSTYAPVFLSSGSPLFLPVIDRSIMEAVAMTVGTFADPSAAQVVLRIRRDGAPLAGVSVVSVGSGFVAYDEGPGVYSDSVQVSATGSAGVVLVLNATPSGAFGTLALSLSDGVKMYAIDPLPVVVGGATIADLSL